MNEEIKRILVKLLDGGNLNISGLERILNRENDLNPLLDRLFCNKDITSQEVISLLVYLNDTDVFRDVRYQKISDVEVWHILKDLLDKGSIDVADISIILSKVDARNRFQYILDNRCIPTDKLFDLIYWTIIPKQEINLEPHDFDFSKVKINPLDVKIID